MRDGECKHFNGIQHDQCARGVNYQTVRQGQAFPCLDRECTHCPVREYPTQEEIEAYEAEVNAISLAFASQLALQMTGESRVCLHCNAPVTDLEQVGRCVYAHPCNCRQYQGRVPTAWKTGK